jgi:hypothetical protein
VWVSSTSPFSVPVCSHWAVNWTCDRRAMRKVTTSASGIVITDTAASSGEIQNIRPMTPMIVSTEVRSWLSPCCSVVLRLSNRAEQVHDGHQAEDLAEPRDVDAYAGGDVHPRQHVGELALAASAQHRESLVLGDPGWQLLADDAIEQDVGRVAEELRAGHQERDRGDAQDQHDHQPDPLRAQPGEQPPQSSAEILGPRRRLPHAGPPHHAAGPPHHAAGPPHHAAGPPHHAAGPPHHAAASSPSWDITISR